MKKTLLTLASVMLAGLSANADLYVCGVGTGIGWDAANPLTVELENDQYQFTVENCVQIKISTAKGDWDNDFNPNGLSCGSISREQIGLTVDLVKSSDNINVPYKGDWTFTVDKDFKKLVATTTTPAPTTFTEIYIRGDVYGWDNVSDEWKFNTTDGKSYSLYCEIPAGKNFKIAAENWDDFNYGLHGNDPTRLVMDGSEKTFIWCADNVAFAEDFKGTISFTVPDNPKSDMPVKFTRYTDLYIVGVGDDINWDNDAPAIFNFDKEKCVYTLTVNNLSEYKISTKSGHWDYDFNPNMLTCDAVTFERVAEPLALWAPQPQDRNNNVMMPWVGEWTLEVSADRSTIKHIATLTEFAGELEGENYVKYGANPVYYLSLGGNQFKDEQLGPITVKVDDEETAAEFNENAAEVAMSSFGKHTVTFSWGDYKRYSAGSKTLDVEVYVEPFSDYAKSTMNDESVNPVTVLLEDGSKVEAIELGDKSDAELVFTLGENVELYYNITVAKKAMRRANGEMDYTKAEDRKITLTGNHGLLSVYTVANGVKSPVRSVFYAPDLSDNQFTVGVEEVEVAGEAVYFDMQGRKVANPEAGMYILVRDGKAKKVVVR